jgi:Domain of unknown function (DUF4157)
MEKTYSMRGSDAFDRKPAGHAGGREDYTIVFRSSSAPSPDRSIQRKASCACGGGCPACQAHAGDLKVSHPNDPAEIEADRIAGQVMRSASPGGVRERVDAGAVHAKRAAESAFGLRGPTSGRAGAPANDDIRGRIDSSRGAGSSLDAGTRGLFEARLGVDLGSVRIHTGSHAAGLNRDLGARAFALGNDIYFNEGQYQPDTESGRHLLAHEVVHTMQQASLEKSGHSIQRTPGENAQESWDAMVDLRFRPAGGAEETRGREAIRRMLDAGEGANLMNALWRLACGRRRSGPCRNRISVSFVDAAIFRTASCSAADADGCFQPDAGSAYPYEVFVKNALPDPPDSRSIRIGGGVYGTGTFAVHMNHTDTESDMATTLFHELLHIKFVNDGEEHIYPTGHADANAGAIDPDFSRHLQRFDGQLTAIETELRRRATPAEPVEPAPEPDLDRPSAATTPAPSRPVIGGRFSLSGGYAGGTGIGSSFTGVVGADLILERIAGLGLGARGVYMSPDRLLTGPALSMRFLSDGNNPLFFDIEAGALFEIPTSTSGRISDVLSGYGSVGIGQEYGTSGARFFWRVGGFVIISDRLDTSTGGGVGGGVTGGVGLRL